MSLSEIVIEGNTYLSYASVEEANIYLIADPVRGAGWKALEDDSKGMFLVAATRRLDLLRWVGEKTDPAQTTEWPRKMAKRRGGDFVPEDAIPPEIEHSCILLAGTIVTNNTAAEVQSGNRLKWVRAGSASIGYFSSREDSMPSIPDPTVIQLISVFTSTELTDSLGATGTGAASSFDSLDPFKRTRGLG